MENKNQTVENTPEMLQRLFSMMENFAGKLELLEKEKDKKKSEYLKQEKQKNKMNDKYLKICKNAK